MSLYINTKKAADDSVTNTTNKLAAQIECSAKTMKELGISKQSIDYGNSDLDPFFCWYCHLFFMNRTKHLLFVNALSRYPVVTNEVTRKEIRNLDALLAFALTLQLQQEGVSHEVNHRITEDLASPKISKSNNRTIIGTAVEYERLLWAYLEYSPHHRRPETPTQMGLKLARTPMVKMRPEPFPYRVFSDQLLARYGDTGHFDFNPIALKANRIN